MCDTIEVGDLSVKVIFVGENDADSTLDPPRPVKRGNAREIIGVTPPFSAYVCLEQQLSTPFSSARSYRIPPVFSSVSCFGRECHSARKEALAHYSRALRQRTVKRSIFKKSRARCEKNVATIISLHQRRTLLALEELEQAGSH